MPFNLLYDYNFNMLLPEIFLATAILILTLFASFLAPSKKAPLIMNSTLNLAFLILVYTIFLCINLDIEKKEVYQNIFIVDNFVISIKGIILVFTLLCLMTSREDLKRSKINNFEYVILILSSCLGLMFFISSNDFLAMYLSLELQSLCLYVLAASKKDSTFSTEAGLKYFVLGSFASCCLLLGISFLYGLTGTVNFSSLELIFSNELSDVPGVVSIKHALFFISAAFFFKIAGAPFHMWVPDVYEGAPTSSAMFFAVVPKIALFTVFCRLFFKIFYLFNGIILFAILLVSFCSVVVGSFLALKQKKLKRLLAYSSISHVGYLLLAFGGNSLESLQYMFFYLIIYMLTTTLLWSVLISIESRQSKTLIDLARVSKKNNLIGLASLTGLFSLMGIPPLAGFTAKMLIFSVSLNATFFLLSIISILTSVVSGYYYLRLIKNLYFETVVSFKNPIIISECNSYVISFLTFSLVFLFFNPTLLYLIVYKISLLF